MTQPLSKAAFCEDKLLRFEDKWVCRACYPAAASASYWLKASAGEALERGQRRTKRGGFYTPALAKGCRGILLHHDNGHGFVTNASGDEAHEKYDE